MMWLLKESWERLQNSLDVVSIDASKYGCMINTTKTKALVFEVSAHVGDVLFGNQGIQTVHKFAYLDSMINGDWCEYEIRRRIGMTYGALGVYSAS